VAGSRPRSRSGRRSSVGFPARRSAFCSATQRSTRTPC